MAVGDWNQNWMTCLKNSLKFLDCRRNLPLVLYTKVELRDAEIEKCNISSSFTFLGVITRVRTGYVCVARTCSAADS